MSRKRPRRTTGNREIVSFLREFDIEEYRQRAQEMDRRFILHIGPTNSGKTYQALQELKKAEKRKEHPTHIGGR